MVRKDYMTFGLRSLKGILKSNALRGAGYGFAVVFLVVLVFSGHVSGQDSLCVHFDSPSSGLHLELKKRHSLNALLPATMCDLRPGESWRLKVDGLGLERKTGDLVIGTDGTPSVQGKRLSSILWNLFLPGRGNVRDGRGASGWSDLGVVLAAGHYYMTEQFEYSDMKKEYDRLLDMRSTASSYEDIERLSDALHYSSIALNVQNRHRKRALIFLSATYAGQLLLDPLLFGGPPSWSVEAGGSIVRLDSSSRTRPKAFMYSLIWPGRGQFYQGKKARGLILTGLAATAGIYVLDRMNAYDEHAFQYEIEIEKWRNTTSPEEKEYYSGRASRKWSELEEVKDDRNMALIILGSIWGLGLLDTFFPMDEYIPSAGGLSVNAGTTGMTVVIDF